MNHRGRKSVASLVVVPISRYAAVLDPPQELRQAEKRVFRDVATSAPHLQACDVPLLTSFAQATVKLRQMNLKREDWLELVKIQSMLAVRLRLSPQSRTDVKTAARLQSKLRPSAYDQMDHADG